MQPIKQWQKDRFTITTDSQRLDIKTIHEYLNRALALREVWLSAGQPTQLRLEYYSAGYLSA